MHLDIERVDPRQGVRNLTVMHVEETTWAYLADGGVVEIGAVRDDAVVAPGMATIEAEHEI